LTTATAGQKSDDGQKQQFEDVFLEHYDFLFRAAKAILRRKAEAYDVVQDLYLKCVERDLQAEIMKNPKAYLHRAAVNAALDWKRAWKRRKEDQDVEDIEIHDASSERANDKVRDMLEDIFTTFKLKAEVVHILILHHNEGYSDAEIADLLGETRSKIASILSRAHARLRKSKELDNERKEQEHRRDPGALSAARFR
jgi:RNA polymerase sigma-70 factor (ECF subfamily)